MQLSPTQVTVLILCWALYALIHSGLASLAVKRWVGAWWPAAMRAYRLTYNTLSVLLLIPPIALIVAWDGPRLWQWSGLWAWVANGLAVAALAGFVWSLRYYDTGVFSGLSQWRGQSSADEEGGRLVLSPLHRFVRHPWYAFALVVLWTRDMDEARLVSAMCVTLYLWAGSLLEERKLLICYGDAYARYRRRVNGLIPWPGRVLGELEARTLSDADPRTGADIDTRRG